MNSSIKILAALSFGFAFAHTAIAADLPSKAKGPAVEYVRICDAFGKGFFYIPGTDTCLKIGGYIRADYLWRQTSTTSAKKVGGLAGIPAATANPALDSSGFRVRARMEFDARSNTEFGPLRGFIRLQGQTSSGILGGVSSTGTSATDFAADVAYVQWAGITAGRNKSFFEGFGSGPDYPYDNARAYDFKTQLLAYTAKLGPVSATLSIEDPVARRSSLFGVNAVGIAGALPPLVYGGSKTPDIVANLRADADWGAVMLSGAYHQANTVRDAAVGRPSGNANGFAVLAGALIKLPSLAAGDEIFLQGAYANGAKSYLSLNGTSAIGSTAPYGLARNDVDAVAVRTNAVTNAYSLEKSRGYTVQAGLTHYWAPTFFQRVWAAYTVLDYGTVTKNTDWTKGGLARGSDFIIATNFNWQPVKDLTIGLDLSYTKVNQTLAHDVGVVATAIPVGTYKKDPSAFATRLRLLRQF